MNESSSKDDTRAEELHYGKRREEMQSAKRGEERNEQEGEDAKLTFANSNTTPGTCRRRTGTRFAITGKRVPIREVARMMKRAVGREESVQRESQRRFDESSDAEQETHLQP